MTSSVQIDRPETSYVAQIGVLALVLGLLVVQVVFYWYWFAAKLRLPLSDTPDSWGQFGDYIGGTLNPVVALCALIWLMRSVKLQERELSETRRALAESAQAQRDQLQVMRRDQKLASLSALVQARSSMLVEAGRTHDFYLAQLQQRNDTFDQSGKPLKRSELETKLLKAALTVQSIGTSLETATHALDNLIALDEK